MSENKKPFAFPFPFLIQVKKLQSALPFFFKEKMNFFLCYLMTAILAIENINISSEKKKGTENEVTSYPLAHYTG